MVDETEKQKAWDECLELWKRLANKQDDPLVRITVKGDILNEIGITKKYKLGCPLCERFETDGRGCVECPIRIDMTERGLVDYQYSCLHTPYRNYERASEESGHHQLLAKAFYDYLLRLYVHNKVHVEMPKSVLDRRRGRPKKEGNERK